MIILMVILLLIILMFAYYRQRSIISPFFLVTLSLTLSSIIILFNVDNWMVDINFMTVMCILVALGSWLLGSVLFNLIYKPKKNISIFNWSSKFETKYPYVLIFLLNIGLTIFFIVYILKGVDLHAGFTSILRSIYTQKLTSSSGNFVFHQVDKIIVTIGYISFLQFMLLVFSNNRKDIHKKLHLFFVLSTLFISLLVIAIGTDRNVFLRFAMYCIVLWFFFFQNNYRLKRHDIYNHSINEINLRATLSIFFILIALVLVFYLMGKAKQYTSNLYRMVGIYAGSGLYNFNLYVKQGGINLTYGASTFSALTGVLSRFGLNIFGGNTVEEMPLIVQTSTNGYVYASNIYSSLQPFYSDFGIFGIALFSYFMGFVFEMLYAYSKHSGFRNKLIYSAFIYPTIYFSIADQFFARLHLGLIYEVFWLLVFIVMVYGRKHIIYRYKKNVGLEM